MRSLRTLALAVLIVGCLLAAFMAGTYVPARTSTVTAVPIMSTKHRIGHRGFQDLTVAPGPGQVDIRGQVELLDPAARTYRWGLVIKEKGTDKVVLDASYPDRIFTVPGGEDRLLDFKDTRPLPPGDYQVELAIYEVNGEGSERGPGIYRDVKVGQ